MSDARRDRAFLAFLFTYMLIAGHLEAKTIIAALLGGLLTLTVSIVVAPHLTKLGDRFSPSSALNRVAIAFWFATQFKKRQPGVLVPPGAWSRRVLEFLFPRKAFENVFAQAIVDMRDEHSEALSEGQLWKARWIVWRGRIGLWFAVLSYLASTVIKKAVAIWKLTP